MKKEVMSGDLLFPELSYQIVGCAFDVFNELGSGHKEVIYQGAMRIAIRKKNLKFAEQVYHPIKFNGEVVGKRFFDFLIDDKVIVELKKGIHFSKQNIDQVLEYIKSAKFKLAILISFGHEGVTFKRIVNFEA